MDQEERHLQKPTPRGSCQRFHSGINGPEVKQIGRYLMIFSVDVTSEICIYRVVPMSCFFFYLENISVNTLNRLKCP